MTLAGKTGLKGQVILITGGRHGIGQALAECLEAEGATVVTTTRRGPPPNLDVRSEESVRALFLELDASHGGVDVLINNAGIGVFKPLESLTLNEWQDVLDTNLTGAFLCAREALPRMRARGRGRIVNIGSIAGRRGLPGMGAYGVSKFGLRGLTEILNLEGAAFGVHACLVTLGAVRVGLGLSLQGIQAEAMLAPADVGRLITDVLRLPPSARVDEVALLPPGGVL